MAVLLFLASCSDHEVSYCDGSNNAEAWRKELTNGSAIDCYCNRDDTKAVEQGDMKCVLRGPCPNHRIDIDPWCDLPLSVGGFEFTEADAAELRKACGPRDTGATCDTGS